ncbi:MAG: ATP-binding protein [Staphylothermus sp.]|nr:ATP-binding protein [Staphylothermus sp.]
MFKITVTGGKGGTGKSFIAVNLSLLLAKHYKTVLVDLDLEAPNDHILLGIDKLENEEPIKLFLPFINTGKCTKCGICAKVCDTGAILLPSRAYPIIFPRLCSGCKTCYYACPYNAIMQGYHVLGYVYKTDIEIENTKLTLVTGVLREGEEHVPPGVNYTRRKAEEIETDILLMDTGAGTGNQISIALKDVDLAIIVTEPTPLGIHDMSSVLKITSEMGIRTWVIINKSNIGDTSKIYAIAKKYGVEKIYEIPYHKDIISSYVMRKPIVFMYKDSPITHIFEKITRSIIDLVRNSAR